MPADSATPRGAEAKSTLRAALTEVTAALQRHDLNAAVAAMRAANEACAGLTAQKIPLDPSELPTFQTLAATCGVALDQAGRELQATSNKRENIRRGMNAYLRGEE